MKNLTTAKQIFFTTIFVLGIIALPATAQENVAVNTWESFDMTMHYSGNAYTKKRRATIDEGEIVHTTSDTSSGLMFSCLEGRLFVAVSWKPQDFRTSFTKTSGRRKGRKLDMKLDGGEKNTLGYWIYKPSLGAVSSRKRSQAAKLYNAVVRKQKVTLYIESKKPVVLDLPKPNRAFAEFGAACGIGKFANKQ